MKRLTHLEWYADITQKVKEAEGLSLDEDMLLCLHNIQNYLAAMARELNDERENRQHIEAMIGSMDQFMSYLAPRFGVPYPESGMTRLGMASERRKAFQDFQSQMRELNNGAEVPVQPDNSGA